MVLSGIFSPGLIKMDLESEDKEEAFEEMVEMYISANPSVSRRDLLLALRTREAKLTTGVKPGIAVPHTMTGQVGSVNGLIGFSRQGIDYDALDGQPVHIIFMLLASPGSSALHLRALKRLSCLFEDTDFYQNLMSQKDPEAVYASLCRFEEMLTSSM
jgi:Phosphotransferase system mannitol/fructose-specific IIA domain (Ntr-type)